MDLLVLGRGKGDGNLDMNERKGDGSLGIKERKVMETWILVRGKGWKPGY